MKRFIGLVVTAIAVACLMPRGAAAQSKSIVVGEGVRGAMYMPAYIAEEKGYFRKEISTRRLLPSAAATISMLWSRAISSSIRRRRTR